jgi:hypothetical protein
MLVGLAVSSALAALPSVPAGAPSLASKACDDGELPNDPDRALHATRNHFLLATAKDAVRTRRGAAVQ